jgi:hypothetical protein
MADKEATAKAWEAYKTARWAQGAAAIEYLEADPGSQAEMLWVVYLSRKAQADEAWQEWKACSGG